MIIVTSGHVDHGKTALLQALTGTHTAHLPEEKKRGMTIDLGYAYLPLKDQILGFIDVPGHERFLANMLAGLGGIHYAMLIVAADEGVQAQTIEHLNILSLLQLQEIMVVITKADRADAQQIDALEQQLRQHYDILANSKFFVTSATTGQGIETLRDYLAQLPELSDTEKPFRYAIDRIFTIKGAGTVVAAPDGRLAINTSGHPVLATAGTGDVLAGTIAALLAGLLRAGCPPDEAAWQAACAGVWLHGRAGERLARSQGPRGVPAGALPGQYPGIMGSLSIPFSRKERS